MSKLTGFIAAFPGTGKSTVWNDARAIGLYALRTDGTCMVRSFPSPRQTVVYDSDSSTFDKAGFPDNYIAHMKDVIARHNDRPFLFLGSSHDSVREGMQVNGIKYVLVYPDRSLKDEYIARYKQRSSSEFFINFMADNWDKFIDSCENDPGDKIVLKSGQFLSDILS